MRKRVFYIALYILLSAFSAKAQDNLPGIIKGKVKDSTYKFVLSSATIAVYKKGDSSVYKFCIPNNFGEFAIPGLPINDSLRLQITHVGYPVYEKHFLIRPDNNPLDIGWVYMHQDDGKTLEEVVIKIAPVRMNGDTLEFNPRAFKMEASATAEDWMRRLDGLVIWSDGDITFNGKKITALYVDGKPFLGGTDVTTATQNLPKDALDALQIYKQRNEKNPLDSTLMANLKLKEDKKMGYFGKAAVGYGTDKRYAADAMLTGFNKRMQISTVGAANNINKMANNVDALIKNSSFKGEGNNIDYQPDFTMAGVNKPIAAGAKFQYDFIPDVEYQKSSRLNADYFLNHNTTLTGRNITTRTSLRPDSILTRRSDNSNTNIYTNQRFSSNYVKNDKKYELSIGANGSINYNRSANNSTDEQERTGAGIISKGTTYAENENLAKSAAVTVGFTNRNKWDSFSETKKKKRIPTGFTIRYSFGITNNEGSGSNRSLYTFTNNPNARKEFDRRYAQRNNQLLSHHIFAQYPYLKQLIFGRRQFGGIDMSVGGNFYFNSNEYKSAVLDLDTASKLYKQNNYLTNNRNENITNLMPEIVFSKQFYKGLTNRYNKYVSLSFTARSQHYTMQHQALQSLQNFKYAYNEFLPQASVEYSNHQYGSYEAKYNFSYQTNINYANVNQIAPLVDSSNLWYIPQGNANILPEYNNKFAVGYSVQSRKPKNPYNFGVNADYNHVKNKWTDSSFYDNFGRRLVYNVNADGYKYWHIGSNIKKAYSPNKNSTFELTTWYNLYRIVTMQYIDKLPSTSKTFNHNIDIHFGFSFRDLFALKLQQNFSFYDAIQNNDVEKRFKTNNRFTRLSGTLLFPKNLTWSSNITYNRNASNNQAAVEYTIWNASLTYRFLKGKQAEIKFSALDLLRQNKSITNNISGNTQTFGYSNVLQQYFMLGIAYYPRKFGK